MSFSLASLIKYSAHLREIDLRNNVLGEMAAADILEALRARKTGRVFQFVFPPLVYIQSLLNAVLLTACSTVFIK